MIFVFEWNVLITEFVKIPDETKDNIKRYSESFTYNNLKFR